MSRLGVSTSATIAVSAVIVSACTNDVVLPSPTAGYCGDGVVDPNEACDNTGPGCTNCAVTPGWQCDANNTCFYPCGDGIIGTGPDCENPSLVSATGCDMTGWWIARENDAVRDGVLNEPQPASTWYLYRFSQTNGVFQIEEALHCGFHVTGSATVDCTPGTLKGLLYENDPSINGAHPRYGTFQQANSVCTFSFDRFYRVRGGTVQLVPADFSTDPTLESLTPLPYEDDPLNPTGQHLQYQEDTDMDGYPGAAFQVSGGLANGIRESTQRDYKEYATSATETVPPSSIEFTVHGDWDLQESVLEVIQCGYVSPSMPGVCSLITTPGHTDPTTLVPSITMRYLGTTLDSPRVAAVVVQDPGTAASPSIEADLETCANVRIALPHDPSLSAP